MKTNWVFLSILQEEIKMIISRNILEFINPQIKKLRNQDIVKAMIAWGLEVESQSKKFDPSKYPNLFFGEIVSFEKVKATDKLSLCQVRLFNPLKKVFHKKIYDIICGANNLVKGALVIIALSNQVLPNGITITEKKIKGILSKGMICSLDELGLVNAQIHSEQGVLIIKKETALGRNIMKGKIHNPIDLFNDYLFEVTSVYNSHFLQNKVLLTNLILWLIEIKKNQKCSCKALSIDNLARFKIECKNAKSLFKIDSQLQHLAYGLLLKADVSSIKQAYDKLSFAILSSLISTGYNLINKVVNYVNLFSYLFGQPMHVYGADVVISKLQVTRANENMSVAGLFDRTVLLTKNDFIIKREDNQIVSIPSILGVEKYAFHNLNNKYVFIEILSIDTTIISNAVKRMNIDTPSSRLGRKYSSKYFVQQAAAFFQNKKKEIKAIRKITINYLWLINNLGLNDKSFLKLTSYLKWLGIDLVRTTSQIIIRITNEVHWIRTESDFMQLCYQLLLYLNLAPKTSSYHWTYSKIGVLSNKLKDLLQFFGFTETNPYLLTSIEKAKWFRFSEWNNNALPIEVINDINPNYKQFATSLLTPLLDIVKLNGNFNERSIRVYANQILPTTTTTFSNRLAIIHADEDEFSFKKYAETYTLLLKILGLYMIKNPQMKRISSIKDSQIHHFLNPFNSYVINWKGKQIGIFGEISSFLLMKHKIKANSAYFIDLSLDEIENNAFAKEVFIRQSSHPKIIKDLTLVFFQEINFMEITNLISSLDFIEDVWINKIFKEKEGYSVSFKFIIFQEHTLSSAELRSFLKKVLFKVRSKYKNVLLKGTL